MGRITSTAVELVEGRARTTLGLFTTTVAKSCHVSRQLLAFHSRPGGRWARDLPEVYRLTSVPRSVQQRMLAALLWAGDNAVLSHRAVAEILDLDGVRAPKPELWVPSWQRHRDVVVHKGLVPPGDVTTTGPLRHTTLTRTLLDLGRILEDDPLELVVESVLRKLSRQPNKSQDKAEFEAALYSGRAGSVALRRVLDRRPPGAPPTESELETRYLQLIRTADVPPPVRQHEVRTEDGICLARLDVCWPEAELWVELDGRATHTQPRALLADRHRQNETVTRLHWHPLHFTWDDVVEYPKKTVQVTEDAYRAGTAGAAYHARTKAQAG